MKGLTIEKFTLQTIADAVRCSDTQAARTSLSFAVGANLDVSGKVQKVIKRDGQFKLVIVPEDVPGFVVFADCRADAENIRNHKIRKGSFVLIRGDLHCFGALAACLVGCRLTEEKPRVNLVKSRGK